MDEYEKRWLTAVLTIKTKICQTSNSAFAKIFIVYIIQLNIVLSTLLTFMGPYPGGG